MKKRCTLILCLLFVFLCGSSFSVEAADPKQKASQQAMPEDVFFEYDVILPWYMQLNETQKAKADTLIEASAEKSKKIHEQLLAKSIELKAHSHTTKPDHGVITELSQEIAKLYGELKTEGHDLEQRLRKDFGFDKTYTPLPFNDFIWLWTITPYTPAPNTPISK